MVKVCDSDVHTADVKEKPRRIISNTFKARFVAYCKGESLFTSFVFKLIVMNIIRCSAKKYISLSLTKIAHNFSAMSQVY